MWAGVNWQVNIVHVSVVTRLMSQTDKAKLSLALPLAFWKTIATPSIEFLHNHFLCAQWKCRYIHTGRTLFFTLDRFIFLLGLKQELDFDRWNKRNRTEIYGIQMHIRKPVI